VRPTTTKLGAVSTTSPFSAPDNTPSSAAVIVFSLTFVFFLLVTVFSLIHYGAGILPQPENLTELYFSDPLTLDSALNSDGKLAFTFTLHNMEGLSKDYAYRVTLIKPDSLVTTLYEGTIRLDDNGLQNVRIDIPVSMTAQDFATDKIQVQLVESGQAIAFWPTIPVWLTF